MSLFRNFCKISNASSVLLCSICHSFYGTNFLTTQIQLRECGHFYISVFPPSSCDDQSSMEFVFEYLQVTSVCFNDTSDQIFSGGIDNIIKVSLTEFLLESLLEIISTNKFFCLLLVEVSKKCR